MKKPGIFGTLDPFMEDGPILGRRVANMGFLRALLARDPFEAYHFFLSDKDLRDSVAANLADLAPGIAQAGRFRLMDRRDLPARLADTAYACFHQSDCISHPTHIARLRNAVSPELFPITGPMHSLSYPDYPVAFLRHLWAGATPRDCIIATSEAGRLAAEGFFTHLRASFSLAHIKGPSIRRVPLGLDADCLAAPLPGPEDKAALRQRLGLPVDRALILVLGRVSHASKMDMLPLIRALSRLFVATPERPAPIPRESVVLVVAGWAESDDPFPQTLVDLGARMGLLVQLDLRPGERRKNDLLAACDIFVSIADNPQETFGITLLEAQAAGLPVVASDYDGYRDLVVHGETGLLVPTTGPEPKPGDDMVDRLAPLLFDNQYHLLLAQRTVVHTPELAGALGALLADAPLRQRMGQAGRARVRAHFLWPDIITRHLELWDELRALPAPDIETLRHVPHPLHLPYARVFAPYPTRTLAQADRLKPGRAGAALLLGREHPVLYAGLDGLLQPEALRKLVFLARKGETAGRLAERFRELCPGLDDEAADYHILWALKHDLLEPEA
ncbi:MAG: glycosyltransferase family 4 protein [Humidesulfovibrio sp.]|nr:glycosyltransferase family 4 protein [Humidesulfovibrio sp.]